MKSGMCDVVGIGYRTVIFYDTNDTKLYNLYPKSSHSSSLISYGFRPLLYGDAAASIAITINLSYDSNNCHQLVGSGTV